MDNEPHGLPAVFALPFVEQIDYFRKKVALPTERWDDIEQSVHDRAFVVAGATKADLFTDLAEAIDEEMHGGEGLEGYRRRFRRLVEKHGWHGWTGEGTPAGEAWRTRVTYMTNLRVSHAAGRYRQLTESGIRYWMWKHNDLVREPREQHLAWNGLVLPADHPFWKLHYPPQIPPHWGCRCRVVGVTNPALARRLGGDPDKALPADWQTVDAEHKTQGPDWNYAPGGNTLTPLAEMVERKMLNYPPAIAQALKNDLVGVLAPREGL